MVQFKEAFVAAVNKRLKEDGGLVCSIRTLCSVPVSAATGIGNIS